MEEAKYILFRIYNKDEINDYKKLCSFYNRAIKENDVDKQYRIMDRINTLFIVLTQKYCKEANNQNTEEFCNKFKEKQLVILTNENNEEYLCGFLE